MITVVGVGADGWSSPTGEACELIRDADPRESMPSPAAPEQGGRPTRRAVTHAEPLGDVTGRRPAAPVTQAELRVP